MTDTQDLKVVSATSESLVPVYILLPPNTCMFPNLSSNPDYIKTTKQSHFESSIKKVPPN